MYKSVYIYIHKESVAFLRVNLSVGGLDTSSSLCYFFSFYISSASFSPLNDFRIEEAADRQSANIKLKKKKGENEKKKKTRLLLIALAITHLFFESQFGISCRDLYVFTNMYPMVVCMGIYLYGHYCIYVHLSMGHGGKKGWDTRRWRDCGDFYREKTRRRRCSQFSLQLHDVNRLSIVCNKP